QGPGFETSQIVALRFELREAGYDERRAEEFTRRLLARLQTMPNVRFAALAAGVPLGSYESLTAVSVEGAQQRPDESAPMAYVGRISREFFSTFDVPIMRGRIFTSSEAETGAPVTVISDSMARRLWPGQDVIGKRFKIGGQTEFREV